MKMSVIDERSEICACYKGIPQNDVGIRTDVMDSCPKAEGIIMCLRSMSPEIIVTDEIGNQGDAHAVLCGFNAGVKFISTAHGYNISELKIRKEIKDIIEQGCFERFIVLSRRNGPGTIEEIVNERGEILCR